MHTYVHRYHITDLILQKSLKDHEDFLMPKIILPLCIQLGLRGIHLSVEGNITILDCAFKKGKNTVSISL